ncbi:dihydroorotate dehydrogenase-like protein [Carboxylicivirga sediminis]|uniref:Dihydroorotate dehydrogenase-like protein n=1 Tax=Carboxylicivirga sediminis TaxID=2006564 RepID=A0A941F3G1_9BACT|nr:dihydroorotate dehydrogenase-like protein [Carboxylicivirga sediminis]MBR8534620.1 dihydroorotate dehydrogenase-like protein [Carboxylicivirga sediminis]
MANLETKYLGLTLKNPIVVSSSGLTNSVDKIGKLVEAGAGAVVLKSLFEEQINHEINNIIYKGEGFDYPEAADYVKGYTRDNSVADYLKLISETKKQYDIPVIASINCFSSDEWVDFAQQIEAAGADALELNVFVLNTDKNSDPEAYEQLYVDVVTNVSKVVKMPVSVKLGLYFSNLVKVVNRLSVSGAKGVVLFNRFYEPDIDINKMALTSAEVLSSPADMRRTLRWVAITSDKVHNIDISASTGVHDGAAVVKQLLAGATSVQTCSAVYKHGPKVITEMLDVLSQWMDEKGYSAIEEFRGLMSYSKIENPALYERAQFMKYFSSYE